MKLRSSRFPAILATLVLFTALSLASLLWTRSVGVRSILLEGTIITPRTVIQDGWVLIQGQKIRLVSTSKPVIPQAIEVDTKGIIFPGLIDLHNHLSWNVLPRWRPTQLFSNHSEWRKDADYIHNAADPYKYLLEKELFCDMNTYGELRALTGGSTSILATSNSRCIQGLVRNLDYSSGFYGWFDSDRVHIRDKVEIPSATDLAPIKDIHSFLATSRSEAFIVHAAEGIDTPSLDEFYFLQRQGLLTKKTVLVHGIALGPPEFQIMHEVRASLVWSPRSNIELYGKTADISSALDAGVQVALAPDWGITGSSNMLDELHYAAQWSEDHLLHPLTAPQLVMMATIIPAEMAGIDDQVGSIRAGLYADLLVLSGDRDNPYQALIQAQPQDVQLVFIGGQPVYGTPAWMGLFWKESELNGLVINGQDKMVRMPRSSIRLDDLVSTLQAALASRGTTLAPLTESQ